MARSLGPGDPQVSIWDHGILYGDGVFDGLRIRGGRLYRPADHLARVRIVVTWGIGLPGLDPRRCPRSSVFVMASPMASRMDGDPLTLITSTFLRKAPAGAKTLNYLDAILAKQQANSAGAGDALMLDASHHVAEATAANICVVRDGGVCTPLCTAALPPGSPRWRRWTGARPAPHRGRLLGGDAPPPLPPPGRARRQRVGTA
jgi:branched-chain amino acid aminotransferase